MMTNTSIGKPALALIVAAGIQWQPGQSHIGH